MIYLGNGIYSDAGSSLSHGGPWKDHKYIKIVNGRYIYPDGNNSRDSKDKTNNYPGFTQKPVPKGVSPRAWFNSPFRLNSDGKWVDGVGTGPKAHGSNIFSKKLSAEPPTKKVPKPDGVGNRKNGAEKTGKKKNLTNDPEFTNDPNVKEYEKKMKKKVVKPKMDKPWTSVNKGNVKSAKSGQNHHSEGLKGWIKDNIIGRPGDTWVHSADGKYMTNTKTGEKKKVKKSK